MPGSMRELFPRSIVCEGAARIPVSADRVWALVGNVGDVTLAKAFVDKIELVGSGVGAVRQLHLPGGAVICERIEEYNAAERYYVYRVIDQGPTNFTHHLALTQVVPAGRDACILSWITTAQPVGGHCEEVRAQLQGNIDFVLKGVQEYFAHAEAGR